MEPGTNGQCLNFDDFECESNNLESTEQFEGIECNLLEEEQMGNSKTYVLHISATFDQNRNIAVGLSNKQCKVYQLHESGLTKLSDIGLHEDAIVGVKFCSQDDNLLYTASKNCRTKLWDLRSNTSFVVEFKDTSLEEYETFRPITCFDTSNNNHLLAAGTEEYKGDAYILFWDIRKTSLLGGYWMSHTDTITQLKFHNDDMNKLISGSTDGLINLYNLLESSEDNALIDSLNTESSVRNLAWLTEGRKDCICCITDTEDVQLWKSEDVEPYSHFKRRDISDAIKIKSEANCYVVNTHQRTESGVLILSGSYSNCLRVVEAKNKKLVPTFELKKNRQIVRNSWYNKEHNILLTVGEGGILNVWNTRPNIT